MNEEDLLKDLEKYFPIDLLTQEEREYAIKLDKEHGHLSSFSGKYYGRRSLERRKKKNE